MFKKHKEGRQSSAVSLLHRKNTFPTQPSNPLPFSRRAREWEWVRLFSRRGVAIHSGFLCQHRHTLQETFFIQQLSCLLQTCHMMGVLLAIFLLFFYAFPPPCFLAFVFMSRSMNKVQVCFLLGKTELSCDKGKSHKTAEVGCPSGNWQGWDIMAGDEWRHMGKQGGNVEGTCHRGICSHGGSPDTAAWHLLQPGTAKDLLSSGTLAPCWPKSTRAVILLLSAKLHVIISAVCFPR